MYDQSALDGAWDLVKSWTPAQHDALRVAASIDGLQAQVTGINMHDIAREAIALSEQGLKARAMAGAGGMVPDETHFLNALKDSIETGKAADSIIYVHYEISSLQITQFF